jgi:peptidoglycan hydrolase CwlO-like protein
MADLGTPTTTFTAEQTNRVSILEKKRSEIEDKKGMIDKCVESLRSQIQAIDCKRFDLCRELAEIELARKTNREYAKSLEREIRDRVGIISAVITDTSSRATRTCKRRRTNSNT